MIDYLKVNSISELTRQEFFEFVRIVRNPVGDSEAEDSQWLRQFERLAQHPAGTDLLSYPEKGKESAEAIMEEVETYRRQHGLPGFKQSPPG